ncbi:hypothetical protein GCM10007424_18300 [Flavobacterium suaedae]|uniref:DUF4270 domain-containing protein n=1 Tax=Flavobacterium suaedae TaxID=1767027 RepID=A0ABQ1JXN9_9FLAO|nr:DUF4270 domain-containing protein [Flavobacterium suaedae]GGB78503.1 hypothetical protein GCM10007424_18300 [Flavobacterium suaedae]
MTNSLFLKKLTFALVCVALFVGCDSDYSDVGADIIDADIHHDFLHYEANVAAYDAPTGAVQTNNLPLNSLGIYNNPVFGKTIASFVTQVELSTANPTLTDPVIDSVYLYVPYFSRYEETDTSGNNIYTLDSVYGNTDARFRLRVYENNYYLRSTNPGSEDDATQRYYSDQKDLIENNKGTLVLNNNSDVSQNEEFSVSAEEVKRTYGTENTVAEKFSPGIFMYLDNDFFQTKVLDGGANLLNNNVFKEYFRGIYFQVEQIGDEAVLAVPRFDEGTITIRYNDIKLDINGDAVIEDGEIQRESKKLTLNLSGNTVNFFENTFATPYSEAITNSDEVNGDDRLYIKGGVGSMGIINILSDEDIAQLQSERILVNEANLVFHVDKDAMANAKEPMRVYLYDLTNETILYDYRIDGTSNSFNPKYGKYIYGGLLSYDDSDRGDYYKLRITNHINNIINNDSTNVKLGLVVTENINVVSNATLKTPFTTSETEVKKLPVSSVIHPFGTVLYGSNSSVPEDKRLKLEIFYTKPN